MVYSLCPINCTSRFGHEYQDDATMTKLPLQYLHSEHQSIDAVGLQLLHSCLGGSGDSHETMRPSLVSQIWIQNTLCKKRFLIISKYQHMHGILNIDEIKN
jgi:hypothetical protein